MITRRLLLLASALLPTVLLGCTEKPSPAASAGAGSGTTATAPAASTAPVTITLGAYTTPREAYAEILSEFARTYREAGGPPVEFSESYLGSGAQARAIVGGFEADLAALSLAPDVETIRTAGLITHDWTAGEHGGVVTRSVVVIGVRPGNPKNIRDWSDLARPDVEVLTPNVRTSGGAMWNVLAIYGAALRQRPGNEAAGREAAVELIGNVLRQVKIMDRGARDSMLTFERGVGDAIITYENEILVAQARGEAYDYVVPRSTLLIENPLAIVDASANAHSNRQHVEALRDFLYSPAAQRIYTRHGLRSVLPEVDTETRAQFAPVDDLFTIAELGGWDFLIEHVFAAGGLYDQALNRSREGRR